MRSRLQALRGRWSCIDGVTVFGWSGSALLGGYLVDRHGFAMVFLLTAALQALSCLAFNGPLLAMVPLFEDSGECNCEPDNSCVATGGNGEAARCEACGCARDGSGATCACAKRDGSAANGSGGGGVTCAQPCARCSRGSRRASGELDAIAGSFDDEWGTLAQPVPRVEGRASREGRRSSGRATGE